MPPSRSPSQRQKHIDELLVKDLSAYRGKDRLYEYSKKLQVVGREQRDEIARLEERVAANLSKSASGGSIRRATDDSKKSDETLKNDRKGLAITYSPSENVLKVLKRNEMDGKKSPTTSYLRRLNDPLDLHYIEADLPSYHLWNDCLHIYFDKIQNEKPDTNGRPEVIVLKQKLDNCVAQNRTFVRTVVLGKLGVGIRFRRITGQINSIWVHSSNPHQSRPTEKTSLLPSSDTKRQSRY